MTFTSKLHETHTLYHMLQRQHRHTQKENVLVNQNGRINLCLRTPLKYADRKENLSLLLREL